MATLRVLEPFPPSKGLHVHSMLHIGVDEVLDQVQLAEPSANGIFLGFLFPPLALPFFKVRLRLHVTVHILVDGLQGE